MSFIPAPVISVNGNVELFRNLIEEDLSRKVLARRPTKNDQSGFGQVFSSFHFQLNEFVRTSLPVSGNQKPFYMSPCLYTYWTDCNDAEQYRTKVKPEIVAWTKYIEKIERTSDVEWIVVLCHQEFRNPKPKQVYIVPEKMKNDFDTKAGNFLVLKLLANDHSKVSESWSTLTSKVYSAAESGFKYLVNKLLKGLGKMNSMNAFEEFLIKKMNIAVGYELLNEQSKALEAYRDTLWHLQRALLQATSLGQCPTWCSRLLDGSSVSLSYPTTDPPDSAWKILSAIQSWKVTLLDVKLFLFLRISCIMYSLRKAWLVEEVCTDILHSTAKEMKLFKVNFLSCGFECWAYAIARMTVLNIMLQLTADVVNNAYLANSPILIRVRLWSYAFDKLHIIGEQCGLLTYSTAVKKELTAALLEGLKGQLPAVEEETQLVAALKSKERFSEVYFDMGMRVIGALKHAGRRRAAFGVAKRVAKFLKHEGGKSAAIEEMLTDICKYCPCQGWMELSYEVYEMLAESQRELGLKEDYLQTVVQLLGLCEGKPLPDGFSAQKWMNQLMELSNMPRGEIVLQSRLKWKPLFELQSVDYPVLPSNRNHSVNSTIELVLNVLYRGPQELLVDSVGITLCPDPKERTSGRTSLNEAERFVESLESIDILESSSHQELLSPTLVDSDEYVANMVLEKSLLQQGSGLKPSPSVSSLDTILEGKEWGHDLYLVASSVVLKPGANHVQVSGLACSSGNFTLRKATLTLGNLAFIGGIPPLIQAKRSVSVSAANITVTASLSPQAKGLVHGLSGDCVLRLTTGGETYIPTDAAVRLSSPTGLRFLTRMKLHSDKDTEHALVSVPTLAVFLPAVSANESHSLAVTVDTPKHNQDDFASAVPVPGQSLPSALVWKHQVMVQLDWLSPPHVALFPLLVYNPFWFYVKQLPSHNRCIVVQLLMENSCPIPLSIQNFRLDSTLTARPLHEAPPKVLLPKQDFSFLWQISSEEDKDVSKECTFSISWRPLLEQQTEKLRETCYPFTFTSVKPEYTVTTQCGGDQGLWTSRPNPLVFHIKCHHQKTMERTLLNYAISLDERFWKLLSPKRGQLSIASELQLPCQVVPVQAGRLPVPTLILSREDQIVTEDRNTLAYNVNRANFVTVKHT